MTRSDFSFIMKAMKHRLKHHPVIAPSVSWFVLKLHFIFLERDPVYLDLFGVSD